MGKNALILGLIYILVLATTLSLQKISPGPGFSKLNVLKDDKIFLPLDKVFDLSEAFYPITSSSDKGQVLTYDKPFTSTSLASKYNLKVLSYAKTLTPQMIALVFDSNKLIIQNLSMSSKNFEDAQYYDLSSIGVTVFCSDVVINPFRPLLYVGCYPTNTTRDSQIRIHTIDYVQQKDINVVYIKQEDGFEIKNRMQLFIGSNTISTTESNLLFLYDQGLSSSKTTSSNNQIRVLRNIEFGTLKFYKLLTLSGNPDYEAIYDYMPYKNGVVVSLRTKQTPVVVSLIYCTLGGGFSSINCGSKIRFTGVTSGYIGISSEQEYFQINTQSNSISIAKLQGNFEDANWNHEVTRTFQAAQLYDGTKYAVRSFSGNENTAVISWVFPTVNVDYGTTYIAWTEDESWKVDGETATPVEEVFLSSKVQQEGGNDAISLTWSRSPYYYVLASDLAQGENNIKVTLTDGASSASNTLDVRQLTSTFEFINVQKPVSMISLKPGQSMDYPLKSENILDGNGLNVSVTVHDPSLLSASAYSSQKISIKWSPNLSSGDILNIVFYEKNALVQSVTNTLNFYTCSKTAPTSFTCSKFSSAKVSPLFTFSKRAFIRLQDVLYAWGTDDKNTYSFAAPVSSNKVFVQNLEGVAQDLLYLPNNLETGVACVVFKDSVVMYSVLYKEEFVLVPFFTIDADNCGIQPSKNPEQNPSFCPRAIQRGCPTCNNEIAVISNCFRNNYILRFNFNTEKFLALTPVHSNTFNPDFCAVGVEYIVRSNIADADLLPVYGLNKKDDLALYSVNLKDFGMDNDQQRSMGWSCVSDMQRVVIIGNEDKTFKLKKLIVIAGGRGQSQNVRYVSFVEHIDAKSIDSYQWSIDAGEIIHLVQNSKSEWEYLVSFDVPKIQLTAKYPEKTVSTSLDIKFTSGTNSFNFNQDVEINVSDSIIMDM